MEEKYNEGRLSDIAEEIKDALLGIENQLEQINKKLAAFEGCIETRTQLPMVRVADITRKQ